MLHLCIGKPGGGKSYWLASQVGIIIQCTNKSHRAILAASADALGLEYDKRASIDDLLNLLAGAPASAIGFDDIDRASAKFCFSILRLAQHHEIYATATNKSKKRIAPILERRAAILYHPDVPDLALVVQKQHPQLHPALCRKIAGMADSPASAVNLAQQIAAGKTPAPTPTNIAPIVALLAVGAATFILRQHTPRESAILVAGISTLAYVLRYALRRQIT